VANAISCRNLRKYFADVKAVPLDPDGWNYITDAMERVLEPGGTSPLAAVKGIEIAGKTGSAQVVSLENRAKHKDNADLAQNGWFVGFSPRRNPDVVVCVLFQGGEHGKLAARLATQVIKAYVEKRRRTPQKMVEKPKAPGTVDVGAFWSDDGDGNDLQAARMAVEMSKKKMVLATDAPGIGR